MLARYSLAGETTPRVLSEPVAFSQATPWGIAAVRAPEAWSVSTGTGARLLIIDTGHQQDHEDLVGVPSSNCFGGFNGCTDGGNYPHGTWVSGVAIARNNELGVVGVAPGLNSSDVYYWGGCSKNTGGGCDYAYEIVQAFDWAANNLGGRGVISISQYTSTSSLALSNAVAGAWAAGHVIVASAGNTSSNTPVYPAAYSNVLGVSGLNQDLSFAGQGTTPQVCNGSYSNYGTHVDLSAPFDAYTTQPTSSYGTHCGTSFATPHVAGAALLVRAANPKWANSQVVDQMIYTAQRLSGPGVPYDTYRGFGIVRADLAAGLTGVVISAAVVSQHPQLSWNSVPLATEYRIYRRVYTNGVAQDYQLWATTTATTWDDIMTASSFFGYNYYPVTGNAVSYHVTAVSAGGFESSWGTEATFIPSGVIPE